MQLGLVDHLLAALFGLVLPLAAALGARRGGRAELDFDRAARIAMYWSNAAFLTLSAGLVLGGTLLRERPLAVLGLAPCEEGSLPDGLTLAALFTALWVLDTILQIATAGARERTRARWRANTPFMPTDRDELAHSLVLVVAAAVCEELVFRGFLVGYARAWLGQDPLALGLAALLPALPFAFAHLYQGPRAAAKILLLSLLFGLILLRTGSLWIPIALHFAVDLVGMLLSPWLLARRG